MVFDYGNPATPADSAERQALARRIESAGEAFRSHFETADLHAKLAAPGFRVAEDLGPARCAGRLSPSEDPPSPTGAATSYPPRLFPADDPVPGRSGRVMPGAPGRSSQDRYSASV